MPELTGSQLKQLRESKNLPLEQVARDTRIQLRILRDLEDDEYGSLPSQAQARGFLRIYAAYLGAETTPPPPQDAPKTPEPIADPLPQEPVTDTKKASSPDLKKSRPVKATRNRQLPDNSSSVVTESPLKGSRSQHILFDIGNTLMARRRYLNLPWEVVMEQTHLRRNQIQALEHGQIELFESPMQASAFLQTYARFLNLDVAAINLRFADALLERRQESMAPGRKVRKEAGSVSPFFLAMRRFFSLDLFFGSLLVLGMLAFLIWGMARMAKETAKAPENTSVPGMSDVLLSSPTASMATLPTMILTPTSSIDLPTPTPLYTPMDSQDPVQLVLIARQNVWVRITVDGDIVYSGRLRPSTATGFTAEESILVETGNASALEFVLNDTPEAHAGSIGEAASYLFTLEGMKTLTIATTPTTTPTLAPTP